MPIRKLVERIPNGGGFASRQQSRVIHGEGLADHGLCRPATAALSGLHVQDRDASSHRSGTYPPSLPPHTSGVSPGDDLDRRVRFPVDGWPTRPVRLSCGQ